MIPVNRPVIDIDDISAVVSALENTWISGETPPSGQLEESLATMVGADYAIAVSSGTSALDISINALGLNSHSTVIAPTFTIISTVAEVLRSGAELLLVDSEPNTWGMDVLAAENALDEKVDLVLPVHIYGLPVQLKNLNAAAKKLGVFVLEDAAEVLGQTVDEGFVGATSSAGIYSFYANKIVTGGEGGAIVTSDKDFAKKARYLRNLCFRPEERFVHTDLGWNTRMSGIQAAVINSQLQRLPKLLDRKRTIGAMYREGLDGHPWFDLQKQFANSAENVYWVVALLLRNESGISASELQTKLRDAGVDTRRFFCPIHMQPFTKDFNIRQITDLSFSEKLWKMGLYLPSGIGNTDSEIEKVIDVLWKMV